MIAVLCNSPFVVRSSEWRRYYSVAAGEVRRCDIWQGLAALGMRSEDVSSKSQMVRDGMSAPSVYQNGYGPFIPCVLLGPAVSIKILTQNG